MKRFTNTNKNITERQDYIEFHIKFGYEHGNTYTLYVSSTDDQVYELCSVNREPIPLSEIIRIADKFSELAHFFHKNFIVSIDNETESITNYLREHSHFSVIVSSKEPRQTAETDEKRLWKYKLTYYSHPFSELSFLQEELSDVRELTTNEAINWLDESIKLTPRDYDFVGLFYKKDGEWVLYDDSCIKH